MPDIDWLSIKADYITGQGTYRSLADKYGIKKDTIYRKARNEKWTRQRDATRDKVERRAIEKSTEKIAEAVAQNCADTYAMRRRIKGKLLAMAERWIDEQEGQIRDAGDYRRIVQCCMDMLEATDAGDEKALRVIMEGGADEYAE